MVIVPLLVVLLSVISSVRCFGGAMIGPGRWWVEDIVQCDSSAQYELNLDITRKKLNRTHDCFTMKLDYNIELNDLFGIELEIYKEMDGGYKYYHYIQDENACNFANKYAKENLEKVLMLAGIDPPSCPVPAGTYTAEEYVFNYSELDDDFPYGKYEVFWYLVLGGERMMCLKMYVDFLEKDDDED